MCRHLAADDITAADDLILQHRQRKALPAPPRTAEADPLFVLALTPSLEPWVTTPATLPVQSYMLNTLFSDMEAIISLR